MPLRSTRQPRERSAVSGQPRAGVPGLQRKTDNSREFEHEHEHEHDGPAESMLSAKSSQRGSESARDVHRGRVMYETNPPLKSNDPTQGTSTAARAGASAVNGQGYAQQQAQLSPGSAPRGAASWNPNERDPRLGYNDGKDRNGRTTDKDNTNNRELRHLPFQTGGGWDHAAILGEWTQIDSDSDTATDDTRCGPSAALAARIVAGPKAVIQFAQTLLATAETHANKPTTPDEYRNYLSTQRMSISFAVAALRSSVYYHEVVVPTGDIELMAMCRDPAGFSDLSSLAHATKLLMTNNPVGLTSGVDMERINRLGTDAASKPGLPVEITSRAEMTRWMDTLSPGEAYMVLIDMDRGNTDASQNKDRNQSDHWITLGREPPGSGGKGGGRTYLYDPWPKAGSQITFVSPSNRDTAFWPYFEVDPTAAGRQDVFKRTIIASSATPKV